MRLKVDRGGSYTICKHSKARVENRSIDKRVNNIAGIKIISLHGLGIITEIDRPLPFQTIIVRLNNDKVMVKEDDVAIVLIVLVFIVMVSLVKDIRQTRQNFSAYVLVLAIDC